MSNTIDRWIATEQDTALNVLFNGNPATVADIESLMAKLGICLQHLKNGKSYDAQYQEAAYRTLNDLCQNQVYWLPHSELKKHQNDEFKHSRNQDFPCVYFIKHPTHDVIKIGYTDHLRQRIRGLRHKLGTIELTVLAVACTECHVQLERLLHHELREHHVAQEWFKDTPVLEWLQSMEVEIQS